MNIKFKHLSRKSDALLAFVGWIILLALLSPSCAAHAGIQLAISPAYIEQQPGDTFTVELTITTAGSEFNAYDALLAYDKSYLTLLQMTPLSAQEGPLMTEACSNRWHIFTIAPDSTHVVINHSLLCPSTTVTGPGVVYRLQFRCGPHNMDTDLRFLEGTIFYDNGLYVTPVVTSDALVKIGTGTGLPDANTSGTLQLSAAPNPFNPRTTFRFELAVGQPVNLSLYALDGRLVRHLHGSWLDAGRHDMQWDGEDSRHQPVASGSYLAVLRAGNRNRVKRVVLIR